MTRARNSSIQNSWGSWNQIRYILTGEDDYLATPFFLEEFEVPELMISPSALGRVGDLFREYKYHALTSHELGTLKIILRITIQRFLNFVAYCLLDILVRWLLSMINRIIVAAAQTIVLANATFLMARRVQGLVYPRAVASTIAKMISNQTQQTFARTAYAERLKARGWKIKELESELVSPDVDWEDKPLQKVWKGQLARVEYMLERAKRYQGQDERLDNSIPHLEKLADKLRKLFASGDFGPEKKAQWNANAKKAFDKYYGKGAKRAGGIKGRLAHIYNECGKGKKGFQQTMALANKAMNIDASSVVNIVTNYVKKQWTKKNGKGTIQTVTMYDRRGDAGSIQLRSESSKKTVSKQQKSSSDIAWERHLAKLAEIDSREDIGGVEDEDSGKDGMPGSISRPIAVAAEKMLVGELGVFT